MHYHGDMLDKDNTGHNICVDFNYIVYINLYLL